MSTASNPPDALQDLLGELPPRPTLASNEYNALADLFLGPRGSIGTMQASEEAPDGGEREAVRASSGGQSSASSDADNDRLELLLAGHLPASERSWIGEHARNAARSGGGPVALLRARDGQVAVDVHGVSGSGESAGVIGDAEHAIEWAGRRADRWVVAVDAGDELGRVLELPADSITVLTGASDMAVVHAYRVLKSIDGQVSPSTPVTVRVLVAGESEDDASSAVQRLEEAARTFLSVPIRAEVLAGPIEPMPVCPVWSGESELATSELIEAAMVSLIRPLADEPAGGDDRSEDSTLLPDHPHPVMGARPTEADPFRASDRPSERVAEHAPSASVVGRRAQLSDYVPGLVPLGLPCIADERATLATDAAGRVHVLVECQGSGSGAAEGAVALRRAMLWAGEHRELLRAASERIPRMPPLCQSTPIRGHLFGRDARVMLAVSDSSWAVHLLSPSPNGWFYTRLI